MSIIMSKAILKCQSGLRNYSRHHALWFFAENMLTTSGWALQIALVRIFVQYKIKTSDLRMQSLHKHSTTRFGDFKVTVVTQSVPSPSTAKPKESKSSYFSKDTAVESTCIRDMRARRLSQFRRHSVDAHGCDLSYQSHIFFYELCNYILWRKDCRDVTNEAVQYLHFGLTMSNEMGVTAWQVHGLIHYVKYCRCGSVGNWRHHTTCRSVPLWTLPILQCFRNTKWAENGVIDDRIHRHYQGVSIIRAHVVLFMPLTFYCLPCADFRGTRQSSTACVCSSPTAFHPYRQ